MHLINGRWNLKKILYIAMDNVLVDYKSGIDFLVDDRPKKGNKILTILMAITNSKIN
jgi:hypothetical protein